MITGLIMTIIGFGIVSKFFNEASLVEKLGISFLLGFGLVIVPLFTLTFFHIRLTALIVYSLLAFLLTASTFLFFSQKNKTSLFDRIKFKKLNRLQILLITGIIFCLLSTFIINSYWPVYTWDSIALYDLQGRLFAAGRLLTDLWPHVGESIQALGYYYSYPPSTSVAHAVAYMIKDPQVMGLYSFFYLSLVFLFFAHVSKQANRTFALFLTLLIASNNDLFYHSSIAYTNLAYAAYIIASIFYIRFFIETREKKYYILGFFFSVMCIFIRFVEPFFLLAPAMLFLISFKDRKFITYFLGLLAACLLVRFFNDKYFVNDIQFLTGQSINTNAYSAQTVIGSIFDTGKIQEVILYLYNSLKTYHLYILFFLLSFTYTKYFRKNFYLALVILGSILALIPGALLLSTIYEGWNIIAGSVQRLMIFLYPLILYYIAGIQEIPELMNSFMKPIRHAKKNG